MWSQDMYLPKENVGFYRNQFTVQYQSLLPIKNVICNKNKENLLLCSSFKQSLVWLDLNGLDFHFNI